MAKEKQEPNIAFIGDGRPLIRIHSQNDVIELPKDQDKPFYHEKAKFIIQHFPHLYKSAKKLGA